MSESRPDWLPPAWWVRLRNRKPWVWARKVGRIRRWDVLVRVAAVVWWDWFGERKVDERWPHLDAWVSQRGDGLDVPAGVVEKELVRLGYDREAAHDRMRTGRKREKWGRA